MQKIRLCLGLLLNLEIWAIYITNILCIICIIKGKLYTPNGNPVYLITSFNLLVDTLQLSLQAFYVGPSVIIGKLFLESHENAVVIFVGSAVFALWLLGSLIQILMAINRLFVVIFPKTDAFSRSRILAYLCIVNICGMILILWSQVFSPCCRVLPDPNYYGYSYDVRPGEINVTFLTVDLPANITTTVIGTISYITMFTYVYRMERTAQVQAHLTSKEIRICFHFLLMFITYLCTWVTFFSFPRLGVAQKEFYIITTVMLTANCGMNSFIYIFLNQNIRKQLRSMTSIWTCQKTTDPNSSTIGIEIKLKRKNISEICPNINGPPTKYK